MKLFHSHGVTGLVHDHEAESDPPYVHILFSRRGRRTTGQDSKVHENLGEEYPSWIPGMKEAGMALRASLSLFRNVRASF
jgi:hypothetical protein